MERHFKYLALCRNANNAAALKCISISIRSAIRMPSLARHNSLLRNWSFPRKETINAVKLPLVTNAKLTGACWATSSGNNQTNFPQLERNKGHELQYQDSIWSPNKKKKKREREKTQIDDWQIPGFFIISALIIRIIV